MKLVHVVPHIDREASGPSYSVPRLCQSLARLNHDVELSCLRARGGVEGVVVDVHHEWPVLSRFAVSPRHAHDLWHKAGHVDIVHNHGLWSMVNVASGLVVPGRRAKLVVSPRGTLTPWAMSRKRLLKTSLWPLQRRALDRASLLHATSEAEYEDIRAQGFTAPVAVIPNGIDVPLPASRPNTYGRKTLLYLGRLHPTKCVDRLIAAWAQLEAGHPDWDLRIVGGGSPEFESELRRTAALLTVKRVYFAGARFGEEKSKEYRHADLYVLPSHSENFGMTVAEALVHGCPVIASTGTPWQGLVSHECGWWVENSVHSLRQALHGAMALPQETLARMGINGRKWMETDFGWPEIGQRMDAAYRWVLSGRCEETRPPWIVLR